MARATWVLYAIEEDTNNMLLWMVQNELKTPGYYQHNFGEYIYYSDCINSLMNWNKDVESFIGMFELHSGKREENLIRFFKREKSLLNEYLEGFRKANCKKISYSDYQKLG